MNGLALCAGAGGLELGVGIAEPEYRAVCVVERQAEAAARLVARMEDPEGSLDPAPIWDDVATFDGRPWRGLVDIVSAGYPCQGESVAGRRRGDQDPRWVWPHIRRILREVEPEWIFVENVANHLSVSFKGVQRDLRRMGQEVAAGVFTAFEAGSNHERKRLFVLAHAESDNRWTRLRQGRAIPNGHGPAGAGEQMAHPDIGQFPVAERRAQGRGRVGSAGEDVAHSHGGRRGEAELRQARRGEPDQPIEGVADAAAVLGQGIERHEPDGDLPGVERGVDGRGGLPVPLTAPGPADYAAWAELLEHHPTLEPALCGAADDVAHRVERLHLIGNGVHPLAAAYAYRSLRAAFAGRSVSI